MPGVLLLVALSLAVLFGTGAPGPTATPVPAPTRVSILPTTWPGLSADEGVFLVTPADDGSQAVYFIAQNTRHSTSSHDLKVEQGLNPLWPVWLVSREVVLGFVEAAPVGTARVGLLGPSAADDLEAAEPPTTAEAPEAAATPAASEALQPSEAPVEADAPTMADAPAAAQPVQPLGSYTVRAGDTLTRLSARTGTSVQAIVEANAINNPDLIYIGQSLSIPNQPDAPQLADQPELAEQPFPAATEDPPAVADQPAVDSLAGAATAESPAVLAAPPSEAGDVSGADDPLEPAIDAEVLTYTVVHGDTVLSIAGHFGVEPGLLVTVNTLPNPNSLSIGQLLTIPPDQPVSTPDTALSDP